jgi:hypothetical protein
MLEEESGVYTVMTPKEDNVDKADIDKCYVGTSMKEKCEKSDIGKCTDIPLLVSAENVHMHQYNIDETILKRSGEKADIDKFNVAEMPKEENGKDADIYKCNDYEMPQDKSCKQADLIKCSEDKTPMQESTVKANIEKRFTDECPPEECFEKADTDDCSNCKLTQKVGETTIIYTRLLDNTLSEEESGSIQRRADEDMNKCLVGDTQLKEVGAGGITKETERNISKCDPCLFEDAEVEATTFCTDCSEHLCLNCSREHRKNKSSRCHMLLDFDDIIKDVVVIETLKSMMTCPDHPETMVTYKCEDHKRLLCVTCLAENHRKCNHVSEISNAKKPGNEDTCTRVKETLCQLQERITALKHTSEEHIASLRSQLAVTQSEQQSFFSSMQEKLTQAENKLESQTKMLVTEEMNNLEKTLHKCKKAEAEEIECNKLFEFILRFGHLREKNVIPDLILKRVERVCEIIEEECRKGRKYLKFDGNIDLDTMSNLANVSIVSDRQDEHVKLNIVLKASSDEYKESRNTFTTLPKLFTRDCTYSIERTIYFKTICDAPFTFEDSEEKRILCKGTDEIFVSTDNEFHCFIDNSDDNIGFVYASWFYKSRRYSPLTGIKDIAADSEGNIYVCGHDSCNVHQISKDGFRISRILISNIPNPTSLSVNIKEGFIVVGCANNDYLHVYYFI